MGDSSLPDFGNRPWTPKQMDHIKKMLAQGVDKEDISSRKGPGNSKLSYIEGWKIFEIANETFGIDGWVSSIKHLGLDFAPDQKDGKWYASASCLMTITLKNGVFHEDVGCGDASDRSKAKAIERAKKEAVTDAAKRALRLFGNRLGNCLYDKQFKAVGREHRIVLEAPDGFNVAPSFNPPPIPNQRHQPRHQPNVVAHSGDKSMSNQHMRGEVQASKPPATTKRDELKRVRPESNNLNNEQRPFKATKVHDHQQLGAVNVGKVEVPSGIVPHSTAQAAVDTSNSCDSFVYTMKGTGINFESDGHNENDAPVTCSSNDAKVTEEFDPFASSQDDALFNSIPLM